ncbi:PepSY domain-containing protein [Hahella ganghwensis]|uniref:PepSY domain-containing protein n=1 Tax=Hahella ganghwensis TaxID=286420 RepID=UPI00036C11C5|nr:hypothetical protein [Hahella ganghwensis]
MVKQYLVVSALLAALVAGSPASAASRNKDMFQDGMHYLQSGHNSTVLMLADNGEGVSASEAARIVQSRTGGKVLRVEAQGSVYKVRVLMPNGVVKTYTVNRSTGGMS